MMSSQEDFGDRGRSRGKVYTSRLEWMIMVTSDIVALRVVMGLEARRCGNCRHARLAPAQFAPSPLYGYRQDVLCSSSEKRSRCMGVSSLSIRRVHPGYREWEAGDRHDLTKIRREQDYYIPKT